MADVLGSNSAAVEDPATAEQDKKSHSTAAVPGEEFNASAGLPASPGQLIPGSSKTKGAQRSSKIPSPGSLSNSPSQARKTKFPSDPLASTGSASALEKIRAAREAAAGASATPADVASTISKAKEALAQARAQAAAAGGNFNSRVSSRTIDGAVSDKPFTLYGKVELPPPRAAVQIHPPDAEEAARRKAWQAEKEGLRQKRLQQEAAAKEREAAAKAAAAAARAEEHKKRVQERKARYEAFKAREAELMAKSEAAWQQYQQQRGRPPLFKTMEEAYLARQAAEEEARRAAYEAEVAAAKLATVSQLVSGEVVIKPAAGGVSPGRNRSPGALNRTPHGSGDHSQALLSRRSPGRGGSLAASWSGAGGTGRHWPAAGPPRHLQLVERASSPLVLPADGSVPPGMKVLPTCRTRQGPGSAINRDNPSGSEDHSAPPAAAEDLAREQEQPIQMQHQHSVGGPAAGSEADGKQHTHKPADKHTSRRSSVQHPQAVGLAGEGGEEAAAHGEEAAAHGGELHSGAPHSRRQHGEAEALQEGIHTAAAATAGKQPQGHRDSTDPPAAGATDDDVVEPAAQVGAGHELEPAHSTAQVEAPGAVAEESGLEEQEGEGEGVASEGSAALGGGAEQEGGDQEGGEQEASDVEASEGLEAAGTDEAGGASGSRRVSGSEAEVADDEEAVALAEQEEGRREPEADVSHRGSGDGEEVAEDIQ